MKKDYILIGVIVIVSFLFSLLIVISAPQKESKPDPPPTKKYCTIKLNDANNQTSYLTGECISNE